MFIKRGLGKIVSVLEEEDVDEQLKKKAKELAQQHNIKTSEKSDTSEMKKSGS